MGLLWRRRPDCLEQPDDSAETDQVQSSHRQLPDLPQCACANAYLASARVRRVSRGRRGLGPAEPLPHRTYQSFWSVYAGLPSPGATTGLHAPPACSSSVSRDNRGPFRTIGCRLPTWDVYRLPVAFRLIRVKTHPEYRTENGV